MFCLLLLTSCRQGRNYLGIKLVEKWVGFKQAFICVKNDNLNQAIRFRSAFVNILQHVYVDCFPQREYTKPKYIWVSTAFTTATTASYYRYYCSSHLFL